MRQLLAGVALAVLAVPQSYFGGLALGSIADGECLKRVGSEITSATCGGGAGVPSGSVILVASGACPTGFTEVSALAGKFLVGTTDGAGDIGGTGGSDTVAPVVSWPAGVPTHSGTAISDHASHTHTYTDVISHNHTQDAHNHTQNSHTHIQLSQTATTGSVGSYEHGTADASSAASDEITPDALTSATTATNIAATATNQATGVATGTTAGPSATLSHTISNQGTIAWPAGVPTNAAAENRPAFVKVIFCSAN